MEKLDYEIIEKIRNGSGEEEFSSNETSKEILTFSTIFKEIKNDWAFSLLAIPLLTIFGNVLVIISIIRFRFLHSRINYLILHLAVADLLVALIVMPFAVYVEIHNGEWRLGPFACNFYSAADVTCSTASILLLLAISFDRFQAATRPLEYSAPKPLRNLILAIVAVWTVSLLIASPIILGANEAPNSENECRFYNADWIIYSSLGSFLIPCLIMFVLYVRIFEVLADRRRFHKKRQEARKKLEPPERVQEELEKLSSVVIVNESAAVDQLPQAQTLIENQFYPMVICNSGLPNDLSDFELPKSFSTGSSSNSYNRKLAEQAEKFSNSVANLQCDESSTLSLSALSVFVTNDPIFFIDDETPNGKQEKNCTIFQNQGAKENSECESARNSIICNRSSELGKENGTLHEKPPISIAPETKIIERKAPPAPRRRSTLTAMWTAIISRKPTSASITTSTTVVSQQNSSGGGGGGAGAGGIRTQLLSAIKKKSRVSRKSSKHAKSMSKEKRATKTLAIVLAVFLVCWVPFFFTNILNAICLKLKAETCLVGFLPFFLTTWLGYMNSFMNPIIYTIFSTDFRRAFRMLLECKSEQTYQTIIIQRTGSSNSN